jgi:hypothetical protein
MATARALAAHLLTPKIQTTKASEEQLRNHVDNLVGYLRNPGHLIELNDSGDYIKNVWRGLGLKVKEDPFVVNNDDYGVTGLGTQEFRNFSVSFGPENGERFIIGAHYDVFGNQPGADDNASGVAALLELTRLMVENNVQPKVPVDLVAYTLEENPYALLGSRVHAAKLKNTRTKVKGMISLEMIGYYSLDPNSQSLPLKLMSLIYPTTGNFICVAGYGDSFSLTRRVSTSIRNHGGIPSHRLWIPFSGLMPDLKRSDHASFSDLGFPACMVTDTSFMRNPNYHKVTDRPETLNFTKMSQVVDGIFELIRNL